MDELASFHQYDSKTVERGLGDILPWVHGFPTGDSALEIACSEPELICRARSSRSARRGADKVFFWLGAAAYTHPDVIMLWNGMNVARTAPAAEAAPWDTGGLETHGPDGRGRTAEQADDLIARYLLPIDDARRYASHVIHVCFSSPADYVAGERPRTRQGRCWYPGHTDYGPLANVAPPCHTFEVRTDSPMPIDPQLYAIVVDPARVSSTQLRELRVRARRVPNCELFQCRDGERPFERTRELIAADLRTVGVIE